MQIVTKPYAFNRPSTVEMPEGLSIADMVQLVHSSGMPGKWQDEYIVMVDGVPLENWNIVPKDGQNIVINIRLHGGVSDIVRTVLTVAVVAAAVWAGGAAATALFGAGGAGATAGTIIGIAATKAIVGGVVMAAGMALVDAVAPIRTPSLDLGSSATSNAVQSSPTYSISGAKNDERPFSTIPVVLGKHRQVPPLATKTFTEISGNDEYLNMLVAWGYGPLKIENLRIGETLVSAFDDVETETIEGWDSDANPTLFQVSVNQAQIGAAFDELTAKNENSAWITRTAPAQSSVANFYGDHLSVDLILPQGLLKVNKKDGKWEARSCQFTIQYRIAESGDSWSLGGIRTVSRKTQDPIRIGFKWMIAILGTGELYEVRIRQTLLSGGDPDDNYIYNNATWTALRIHNQGYSVTFPHTLAVTTIRIKATDQLSGYIDNLNADVTSYAPNWTGSAWQDSQSNWTVSQNPAALMRLVLMGNANARARTAAQIDGDTLGDFHDFCSDNGYKFNMIRDFQTSVFDVCSDICAAGRASPILDGLWSVTTDKSGKSVRQHFTPRNSWGFEASKIIQKKIHAWRIKFNNEYENYLADEMKVYDDGYSSSSATEFEAIELPGITQPNLVWKFGRFHIAQLRLRPEEYVFNVDFEHLACQRGDIILVSHDVPMWGLGWGRVKSLTGSDPNITAITVDESFVMEAGESYNVRIRKQDGSSLLADIDTVAGANTELTFQSNQSGINDNDLVMFGETSSETQRLLVKKVEREKDLVAKITCVDESSDIYSADTGTIPDFETNITESANLIQMVPLVPQITSVESGLSAAVRSGGTVLPRIIVQTELQQSNIIVNKIEVQYRNTENVEWQRVFLVGDERVAYLHPVVEKDVYEIRARAISVYRVASDWSTIRYETVEGLSQIPPDVENTVVHVVGTQATLTWDAVTVIDLSHYRVRWSPVLSGATWNEAVTMAEKITGTSVSLPALVGTYMVKAEDVRGNLSDTAGSAITNIASLSGLNLVATQTEQNPDWDGTKTNIWYSSDFGGILLDSTIDLYDYTDLYDVVNLYGLDTLEETGYYYFENNIDLSSKFTSRVSGDITAVGEDISNDLYDIEDLYTVTNLFGADDGEYSVELQIRITDDNPSGTPAWGDWSRLIVGDYAARAFEFRLKLTGNGETVTPIVSESNVTVDMPDRTLRFAQTISAGGSTVSFSPAFYDFPADAGLGISVKDGQEGDKYTITNLDETGFDIAFTNGGGNVERDISGLAQSYGEVI